MTTRRDSQKLGAARKLCRCAGTVNRDSLQVSPLLAQSIRVAGRFEALSGRQYPLIKLRPRHAAAPFAADRAAQGAMAAIGQGVTQTPSSGDIGTTLAPA
jgi:hypothetical protein